MGCYNRSTYPHYNNSTLPPSEEGVLYHPQLIPEEHKLALQQCFRKDVCNLFILCKYTGAFYLSS